MKVSLGNFIFNFAFFLDWEFVLLLSSTLKITSKSLICFWCSLRLWNVIKPSKVSFAYMRPKLGFNINKLSIANEGDMSKFVNLFSNLGSSSIESKFWYNPFKGVFIIFNIAGCKRKNFMSKSDSSLLNSIVGWEYWLYWLYWYWLYWLLYWAYGLYWGLYCWFGNIYFFKINN